MNQIYIGKIKFESIFLLMMSKPNYLNKSDHLNLFGPSFDSSSIPVFFVPTRNYLAWALGAFRIL